MKTVAAISLFVITLFSAAPCISGNRCEVTGFKPYEKPGVGYQAGAYYPIVEKCAEIMIRNTGDSHWFATDIRVTAFFENGDATKSAIDGEKDRLQKVEPGKTYSTTVCFGADPSQIRAVDCDR
jgi:hypothetical protein